MKFLSLIVSIFFITSVINVNIILSYISLFLIVILIMIKSPESLRFSGGVRFWLFPLIFFLIISFDYNYFVFDKAKIIYNLKMFLHLYVFSVLINFINDNTKLSSVYSVLDKYRFYKIKFAVVFSLAVMKKMKTDIQDIFFFYRLNNTGIKFFKNIYMLIYVIIRNSIRICYDMIELLYLRGIYER